MALLLPAVLFAVSADLELAERALKSGDYAAAKKLASEAASRYETAGDRDKLGKALNTAGAASIYTGDYDGALALFEKSLRMARQVGDVASEVRRQHNIGGVYFYRGNYVAAYARYQAGLARLAGSESQPWYTQIRQLALSNLAILHQQLGQNQRALELYREIRSLPLKLAPNVEAQMLTNLAIVYRRLGDPQKALETYRRARELLARDPNAAAALYTLHNVGVVLALDFEDYPAALGTFNEALAVARKTGSKREAVLERLFLGQTLLLMKRYDAAAGEFRDGLAIAKELNLVDERWTALYGLGRVHAARGDVASARREFEDAIAVIESARSKLSSGAATLKDEFLADKRDVYDAVIALLLAEPGPPVPEIWRRIEEGRSRNLKEILPAEQQAVDLASVQRSLGNRDVLVEYWMARGRLAALWVTRAGWGVVSRPVDQTGTESIADLTRAVADPRSETGQWRRLAKAASVLLLAGLPLDPAKADRLIFVPGGDLGALPFEILELPDGARLIDRFDISYLPSAHFLARSERPAPRCRWPWEPTLTVFADPQPAQGAHAAASPFDAELAPLAYSPEEARAVARALPGAERMYLGAENLKRHLFEPSVGESRVLHFATHAAVDVNDSRRSRMIFTPEAADPASRYLFWGDIAKLRLSGVELVTLAACESERGRFVRGEGVESFSRAFLAAGAASAVSSLWRVSDRATARLMASFYSGLAAGETKAAALRRAKLEFSSTAHPFYWAAFVLIGDGSSPLSPVIRWWQVIGAAVLVAAGGLLAWRRFSPAPSPPL